MSAQRQYSVLYQFTGQSYCAYCPDVPGCLAAGDTMEETRELMREALKLHLRALEEEGVPLPEARTYSERLDI